MLQSEHYSRSRTWASWGDYDRNQFVRQCSATNVPYPFGNRHVNAKRLFSQVNGLKRKLGMAQALQHAGISLEGRHHSGIDDAWNIAALILQLAESDASALAVLDGQQNR